MSLFKLLGAIMGSLILVAAMFLVMNTVYLGRLQQEGRARDPEARGRHRWLHHGTLPRRGLIQGLIGSMFALLGLAAVHRLLVARLKDAFELVVPAEPALSTQRVHRGLFIAGAILGVGASLLAVYRFLSKVN